MRLAVCVFVVFGCRGAPVGTSAPHKPDAKLGDTGPYDPGVPVRSQCTARDVNILRIEGAHEDAWWQCSNGANVTMRRDAGWRVPDDEVWGKRAFASESGENPPLARMGLRVWRDRWGRRHAEWRRGFDRPEWGIVHVAETRDGVVRVQIGGYGGIEPSAESLADLRHAFVEIPLFGADGLRWSARRVDERPTPASPAPLAPPAAAPQAGARVVELPGAPRVRTTCPTMSAPVRAPALVATRYENAASALPTGLRMMSESAIGDTRRTVIAAMRGTTLTILLARARDEGYEVDDALELRFPCTDLLLEARTCDVDGKPDARVVALMSTAYQCGGHGASSPVRAWRVRGRKLVEIDAARVTCGSETCEVDR